MTLRIAREIVANDDEIHVLIIGSLPLVSAALFLLKLEANIFWGAGRYDFAVTYIANYLLSTAVGIDSSSCSLDWRMKASNI